LQPGDIPVVFPARPFAVLRPAADLTIIRRLLREAGRAELRDKGPSGASLIFVAFLQENGK